jgi:kinesin family protein C1
MQFHIPLTLLFATSHPTFKTGSGKTFTMIGDKKNPGLIPRSVQMFFDTKADIEKKCQAQGQVVKIDIGVELLEVYNDEVRDLLSPNAGPNGKLVKVDVQGHEAVGNVVASASSQTEVEKILAVAQSRRCVKATNSNAESSRSHMLFTIHFKVTSSTNDELNRNGCLHITDLAGSERLDKSGSYGQLLTEAKHINLSLHALTGVIEKLQEKSEHIPYRNSKLTYLLRNSLGGDSKTLAIVCCSPQQEHFQESHSSIRFAAKASKVELKNENEVHV